MNPALDARTALLGEAPRAYHAAAFARIVAGIAVSISQRRRR